MMYWGIFVFAVLTASSLAQSKGKWKSSCLKKKAKDYWKHSHFLFLSDIWSKIEVLERFSFECRKVIGFAISTLCDWLKKLAPLFHPIRSKTKTNRNSLARVFPPFTSATCNYFEFWLVHCIVCVLSDWLEWLLWFWFYDTQLKTALIHTYQSVILFNRRLVNSVGRAKVRTPDRTNTQVLK